MITLFGTHVHDRQFLVRGPSISCTRSLQVMLEHSFPCVCCHACWWPQGLIASSGGLPQETWYAKFTEDPLRVSPERATAKAVSRDFESTQSAPAEFDATPPGTGARLQPAHPGGNRKVENGRGRAENLIRFDVFCPASHRSNSCPIFNSLEFSVFLEMFLRR